jgi:signal recognition particle subunit SEC65
MNNKNLSFLIKGKEDEVNRITNEISEILKEELKIEANVKEEKVNPEKLDKNIQKDIGIVLDIVTFVVSVPAVAISIQDVYERIKRKKNLDSTIEKVKEIKTSTYTIKTVYPDGRIEEIRETNVAEILDQVTTK